MHVEGPNPVVLAQHGEVSDVDLYWTGGVVKATPNNPSGSPVVVGAKVSRESRLRFCFSSAQLGMLIACCVCTEAYVHARMIFSSMGGQRRPVQVYGADTLVHSHRAVRQKLAARDPF